MKTMKRRNLRVWLSGVAVTLLALLMPIAEAGHKITYYHSDLQGSPVMATDESGAVLWREEYKPYGEKTQKTAASLNDVGYTGHQSEDGLGLVYMQQRYYDPLLGRFLSNDPVGFKPTSAQSFTRYAYANNNPYRYTDPDGRETVYARMQERQQLGAQFAAASDAQNNALAGMATDFAPGISDVAAVSEAVKNPTGTNIVVAGLGLVPVIGDAAAKIIKLGDKAIDAGKRFSKEKEALVDMAKKDEKIGATREDIKAYKELNDELPDPFGPNQIRVDEGHASRAQHSQVPHGHVGPVDYIPIKDPEE